MKRSLTSVVDQRAAATTVSVTASDVFQLEMTDDAGR